MDEFALNDDVNVGSMLAKLVLDRTDGVEVVVCSNNEVDDSEIIDDKVVNSIIFENIELNTDETPSPPLAPVALSDGDTALANGTLANIISSRKLIVTGLFRHFSEWRERIFRYDRGKNVLIIESKVKKYELKMNNLIVKDHPYHNTQVVNEGVATRTEGYCLLLTYTNSNDTNLHNMKTINKDELIEMMMLFPSKEEKNLWKVTLERGITHELEQTESNNHKKVKLLLNYLNERHELQTKCDVEGKNVSESIVVTEDEEYSVIDVSSDASALGAAPNNSARLKWDGDEITCRYNDNTSIFTLPIPNLSILMLVVGTKGDVQPFVLLGQRLMKDGHRVRLATHSCFRNYVIDAGLEFYPLAGDPYKLSEFMVKTHGCIVPTSRELLVEVPGNITMLSSIVYSCWDACIKDDPNGTPMSTSAPFLPDSIIANPVAYGHIHCAEALKVPLHLMFPQPWVPTKAFPHPLSMLPYSGSKWSTANYLSYSLVEKLFWLSLEKEINTFRTSVLNLEEIRMGDGGWNILNTNRIPFVKLFSSVLVPKPKDWGDHVDIVGSIFDEGGTYQPPIEIVKFVTATQNNTKKPIIFIGFGSMVIEDLPTFITNLLIGAALVNIKIIFQNGWSALTPDIFRALAQKAEVTAQKINDIDMIDETASVDTHPWRASDDCLFIGPVPHSYLFNVVDAVVHHGGAGTTAAGIKAGKPTWICPFFGDQFFWGEVVHKHGIGPRPCTIKSMSLDIITAAYTELLSPKAVSNTRNIASEMGVEDGLEKSRLAFYKNLPLERMLCDVSLLCGEANIAHYYCVDCKCKMSREVSDYLHQTVDNHQHRLTLCSYVDYHGRITPSTTADGFLQGLAGFVGQVSGGIQEVIVKPAQGGYTQGPAGAAVGIYQGVKGLILSPYNGTSMFINKIREGFGAIGSNVDNLVTHDSIKSRLLASKDSNINARGNETEPSTNGSAMNTLDSIGVDCEESSLPFAMSDKDARKLKLTKAYNKVMYISDLLHQLRQVQKEQRGRTGSKVKAVPVGLIAGNEELANCFLDAMQNSSVTLTGFILLYLKAGKNGTE